MIRPVVRLTDVTQPSAHDTSSSESSESDQKEEGGKALKDTEGQNQAEENAGAEEATAYVRCENVKQ